MGEEQAVPDLNNTGLAFGLVTAAGLSTALGAALIFNERFVKLARKEVLSAGLGFSGGVMIYVSFVEIFVKSQDSFKAYSEDDRTAYLSATACLFAGMLLLRLIALLVHAIDKRHPGAGDPDCVDKAREASANAQSLSGAEAAAGEEPSPPPQLSGEGPAAAEGDAPKAETTMVEREARARSAQLQRMGLNTAAAIAIHNFPEGLATFVATLADPYVGFTLAIAIGIHNIPEGLCVALPIYYAAADKNQSYPRWRAFLWALLSGISEPVGAFIGWCVIKGTGEDMNAMVYGILFGLVAGMMIMIVILELLPTAYRYDPQDRYVTNSTVFGMLVMAASLCLFVA